MNSTIGYWLAGVITHTDCWKNMRRFMDHKPETSDEQTFLISIFKGAIKDSILTN